MTDSQKEATAAALSELGYDVGAHLSVHSVQEGSAAEGLVEEGDVIVSADGTPVASAGQLREIVNAGDGAPVDLVIERDGEAADRHGHARRSPRSTARRCGSSASAC